MMCFRLSGHHHYEELENYFNITQPAADAAPRPFSSTPAAAGRHNMQPPSCFNKMGIILMSYAVFAVYWSGKMKTGLVY